RPVILGPVTFLKLAKSPAAGFNPLGLLPKLLPVYEEILRRLAQAGADWVQIDEPALVLDLIPNEREALKLACERLARAAPGLKIMLATYFGARRQSRHRGFASRRRPPCRSGARTRTARGRRPAGAQGSGGLARPDRRPQCLARRPDRHS